MRLVFRILGALLLAQCASSEDTRFRVGQSARAMVVMGLAEAADTRQPRYTMLWRRLDAEGAFLRPERNTAFEVETNRGDTIRVRGIPGEFTVAEVEPGAYALDSVFAVLSERGVNYIAQGVIEGPTRPAFEVRAGEAIYLGIWEARNDGFRASVRPWRLSAGDLQQVARDVEIVGAISLREAQTREVACTPHRINSRSQRQIC